MAQKPAAPASVDAILASMPADRREAIAAVRRVILDNLDAGYEEGVQYGMIAYYVPHSIYPAGYHCDPKQPLPYLCLASQKSHMALYLFCVYTAPGEEQWFRDAWTGAGKKLDMGKSCVRFKRLEDVPLEVVGETIRRSPVSAHIAAYEAARAEPAQAAPRKKTAAAKSSNGKKAGAAPKKKVAARARTTSKTKPKARKAAR